MPPKAVKPGLTQSGLAGTLPAAHDCCFYVFCASTGTNTKLHFETTRGKDIHNPIASPMSREMSQKKFFAFNTNSRTISANPLESKARPI
jgi:hypothetical protein